MGDWRTIESKRQSIHGCPHFYFPHANAFSLQESAWAHAPGRTVPLAPPWKNNVAKFRLGIAHCPCSLQPSAWCMPQVDLPITHARRKIAWLLRAVIAVLHRSPSIIYSRGKIPLRAQTLAGAFLVIAERKISQNCCLESLSGHACR